MIIQRINKRISPVIPVLGIWLAWAGYNYIEIARNSLLSSFSEFCTLLAVIILSSGFLIPPLYMIFLLIFEGSKKT